MKAKKYSNKKINYQKIKEKNNSNSNNKKINKSAHSCNLLYFFFQMMREKRCDYSCFYVRAYLIPDLWSKK